MKSKLLIAAALIGLVAAGCNSSSNNSYGSNQTGQSAQNPNSVSEPPAPAPPASSGSTSSNPPGGVDGANQPEVAGINITASGFVPSTVTIHKGDYVMFTNKDTDQHWPASDPHPIHNGYPGFDAKRGLSQGQTYTFQFERTGTFGFHDHLNPTVTGKVIVQ